MSDDSDGGGGENVRRSKVQRVIDGYGLGGTEEELERYWLGEGVERRSLRDLADFLNRRMVRAAMTDAGINPLDGEAANTYRLLTDDEVTSGERTKVERHLDREGIDVDQLRSDFVSHQVIHTYLTDVLKVSLNSKSREFSVEKGMNTNQRLNSRSKAVSERTVETLVNQEAVTIGAHTITVETRIVCLDCNRQYELVELLERGHCDCRGQ